MPVDILHGDCVEVMAGMAGSSVDVVVTDPPYELGFMGKHWDASGVAYQIETWAACLRVLKPGGHLLAFGGSRTYHRMACAVEDAGFEIRDQIMWLYGSGFPKSLDVSKAMDKAAGAWRKTTGTKMGMTPNRPAVGGVFRDDNWMPAGKQIAVDRPATGLARKWQGWGTALKPAHEPIVVARKPLIGTVAANVEKYGTGALNVDGCRVETDGRPAREPGKLSGFADVGVSAGSRAIGSTTRGRWPANVILDEAAGAMLDEQSGGASRFFYCPKASRKEREAGLAGHERKKRDPSRSAGQKAMGEHGEGNAYNRGAQPLRNHHPTVKPVALMRYLVRLVTPPGGVVLDPFLGSGTTALACIEEGFDCIGIEREEEYVEIARTRVKHWQDRPVQTELGGRTR